MEKRGFTEADMERAGLVKKKDHENRVSGRGGELSSARKDVRDEKVTPTASSVSRFSQDSVLSHYYDRFRDRIMFPIMDSSGRIIAFSGRLLHEKEGEGKYINTPDSPLYDKSAVLYG